MVLLLPDAHVEPFRSALDVASRRSFPSHNSSSFSAQNPLRASAVCGLGPNSIYSCIQGSGLFSNTRLLFLTISHLTVKLRWTPLCSENVPLYVLFSVQSVVMFSFPGMNGPIIQIIIIL